MATNKIDRVAWDSVVVLDHLNQTPNRYPYTKPIAKDAEEGRILIVVSVMAIAETVYLKDKDRIESDRIIRSFFDSPCVAPYAVGTSIAELAQQLRRDFKLSGHDAVHVASALISKCPILVTNDGDGTSNKKPMLPLDQLIKHAGLTLRICTPKNYPTVRLSMTPGT